MVALVLATFLVFPSRYEELRQAHMGDDAPGGGRQRPGKKCRWGSAEYLGQEEHHTSSDSGPRAPGSGASTQPNGRPRKVTHP